MNSKDVVYLKHCCVELEAAFKSGKHIQKWIDELERIIGENLNHHRNLGKSKNFLSHVIIFANRSIEIIKLHLSDTSKCLSILSRLYSQIDQLVDQGKVRDQIIKEIMHPFFKKHGFKKEGRRFIRVRGDRKEIVSVFSSRWNTFESVDIRFEVTIVVSNRELVYGHQVIPRGYRLEQDFDLDAIKARIQADMPIVLKYVEEKI